MLVFFFLVFFMKQYKNYLSALRVILASNHTTTAMHELRRYDIHRRAELGEEC